MPMYTFDCGDHKVDHIASLDVTERRCHCGRMGQRQAVYAIRQAASPHASEFEMPGYIRDMHDEALGYKAEAVAAKAEAEANGFRLED